MSAPERIYLQDDGDYECAGLYAVPDGITWCADQINDADIAYVRADLFERLTAERDALRALLVRAHLYTDSQHYDLKLDAEITRALTPSTEL